MAAPPCLVVTLVEVEGDALGGVAALHEQHEPPRAAGPRGGAPELAERLHLGRVHLADEVARLEPDLAPRRSRAPRLRTTTRAPPCARSSPRVRPGPARDELHHALAARGRPPSPAPRAARRRARARAARCCADGEVPHAEPELLRDRAARTPAPPRRRRRAAHAGAGSPGEPGSTAVTATPPEAPSGAPSRAGRSAHRDPEVALAHLAVGDEVLGDAPRPVDGDGEADARRSGRRGWRCSRRRAAPRCRGARPPELPGLMEASVWTKSKRVRSPALKFRCTAETTPVVTVCERPNGFPMAITVSPMRRPSERPSRREGELLLRVELQDGEVGGRIGPDHLGEELAPVEEPDPEAGAALHHVVVREDVPVGRDDDARAERGDLVAARGSAAARRSSPKSSSAIESARDGTRMRTSSSAATFTTAPRTFSTAATTGVRRAGEGRSSGAGAPRGRGAARGGERGERDGEARARPGRRRTLAARAPATPLVVVEVARPRSTPRPASPARRGRGGT